MIKAVCLLVLFLAKCLACLKSQNSDSPPLCVRFPPLHHARGYKMLIQSLGVWHVGEEPVYVPFHCSWYCNQHASVRRQLATEVWERLRAGEAAHSIDENSVIYRQRYLLQELVDQRYRNTMWFRFTIASLQNSETKKMKGKRFSIYVPDLTVKYKRLISHSTKTSIIAFWTHYKTNLIEI